MDGKQDRLTAGDGIQISSDNTVSLTKTGAGSLNVRITPFAAVKGVIGEIDTEPYISGNYGYYMKFKFAKGTLRRDDSVKENNSVVDVIGDYYVDAMGIAPYCGINSSGSSEFDEIDLYMEKEWPVSSDADNALIVHFTFIRVVY